MDSDYLRGLGIDIVPAPETLSGLARGSQALADRLEAGTLVPRARFSLVSGELPQELEIHNYTGACPTLTFEINPVRGCHVGCQYCLVSDGDHQREIEVLCDYPALVERVLDLHHHERHFFYFSPKTEALQRPTLQTGVAHEILRVFVRHYERHPNSLARLFFASKGGTRQLEVRHDGDSVLDLFEQLRGRMQFNTSVCIMPEWLRRLLEPHAPSIEERLEAVRMCQHRGVMANSALVQPILTPWLEPTRLDSFFAALASAGIVNFKPELLTVDPACLAIIGQIVGHFDKAKERALYEAYVSPSNLDHKKQRDRTAPDRDRSRAVIGQLLEAGARYGLTASICFWVREALDITEQTIPTINRHGFQCLGYQTSLFEPPSTSARTGPRQLSAQSRSTSALPPATPTLAPANRPPLRSWDEWSPLREVVVGRAVRMPGWSIAPPFDGAERRAEINAIARGAYPDWLVEEVEEDLDDLVGILRKAGVRVLRPAPHDGVFHSTSHYTASGEGPYNVRDLHLVAGETVIESPTYLRHRATEARAFSAIWYDYLDRGCRWLAAPRPHLAGDHMVEFSDGARSYQRPAEIEAMFEAANVVRMGRDLLYLVARSGNRLGARWLQSALGEEFIVHVTEGIYRAGHIDTTVICLRPGLVLFNGSRVGPANCPSLFEGWDRIFFEDIVPTPPEEKAFHDTVRRPIHDRLLAMGVWSNLEDIASDWIGLNVLSLGTQTVLVDKRQLPLARELERWGFTVVPVRFRHAAVMGGGLHCATLDTVRDGEAVSFFDRSSLR